MPQIDIKAAAFGAIGLYAVYKGYIKNSTLKYAVAGIAGVALAKQVPVVNQFV